MSKKLGLLGLIFWLLIGYFYGKPQFDQSVSLNTYLNSIPKGQDKNVYLYGTDLLMYQALSKTPIDTKILYLIPDLNNYPARAAYFLYPRPVTYVATFEQALQKQPETFDYVMMYINTPEYSGYMGGLSGFQSRYWQPETFISFINQFEPETKNTVDQSTNLIHQNLGNFLYRIYH